jgi:hypothetical protein
VIVARADKIERKMPVKSDVGKQADEFVEEKSHSPGHEPNTRCQECHQRHAELSRLGDGGVSIDIAVATGSNGIPFTIWACHLWHAFTDFGNILAFGGAGFWVAQRFKALRSVL